jgi:hypothetical protein
MLIQNSPCCCVGVRPDLATWLILQHSQRSHGGVMGFESSVQDRLLVTGRGLGDWDGTGGHHIAPYCSAAAALGAPSSGALAERSKSGPAIPSIYSLHQEESGWLGTAQFRQKVGLVRGARQAEPNWADKSVGLMRSHEALMFGCFERK